MIPREELIEKINPTLGFNNSFDKQSLLVGANLAYDILSKEFEKQDHYNKILKDSIEVNTQENKKVREAFSIVNKFLGY